MTSTPSPRPYGASPGDSEGGFEGDSEGDFAYDNRTGRGPGRVVRTLGLVLPGVRAVQAQVVPYADAWSAHNRGALARPGRRWIVLGDSMSQGVGAAAHDRGWVGLVARRLADAGPHPRVVNLSATGARVPDVVQQQLPVLASLPEADPGDGPDLVTVMVGSNDLYAGRDLRTGLPAAFAEMLERLPDGAVVTSLPQPLRAAREANQHLSRAVRAGRVRVVDLAADGPTSWRGKVAADRFHPNEVGYAAIADAVAPVVVGAWREDARRLHAR